MRDNKEPNVKQHDISILGNEVGMWVKVSQNSIGWEDLENEANHNVIGNSGYCVGQHTKHYLSCGNRN